MFKYKMSEDQYKDFYTMKDLHDQHINQKKKDIKKQSRHKYPNGGKYTNNWNQQDIIVINKIRNLKGICYQCKKPGMKFIDSNKTIIAKCDAEDNCGYEFKMDIPEAVQYNDISYSLNLDIENLKEKIIKWKLNLLFKLDNEDVVLKEFQALKLELDVKTRFLKKIQSIHLNLDKLTIEENGEQVPISRKNLLKKLDKKIIMQKENYKNILKNHINNNVTENDQTVKDAMMLHQNIMNDIDEKRKIEYELGHIEMIQVKNDKDEIIGFKMNKIHKNYASLEHIIEKKDDDQ
tara:strand:- start:168 stop:1040 length:873 start_codon:yes stop_codon:yes gene_type:complete